MNLPHKPENAALTIYLSGPMKGIKDYNGPAFDAAAKKYRALGFTVVSPAEMDRKDGLNCVTETGDIDPVVRRKFLVRDIAIVSECDALLMLKGWSKSGGAKLERTFALDTGIQVLYDNDAEQESNEVRITDPKTGGQKGQKLERMDLVPVEPLLELSRVYGMGAKKYADNNWRQGYSWSLSYAALMRHAMLLWAGEDKDKESGLSHAAHCAFHCFSLMEFAKTHRDGDDRWKGKQ